MKRISKTLACTALAAAVAGTMIFGGCAVMLGKDGADGKDGQDVSIYEIYDATNAAREEAGLPTLTFLDFIAEYLNYTGDELEQATSLQSAINRSLLSAVSILTTFTIPATRPYMSDTEETYAGSGVIIDIDKEAGDMYVVTNGHVVYVSGAEGDGYCDDINLYLYGSEYASGDTESTAISASIVGVSLTYDIAVLKVEGSELVKNSHAVAAEWSDSETVFAGESVYAVGNPEGALLSVTTGIISRDSEYISIDMYDTLQTTDDFTYRVLRTDAAINGGNSGGGLFNKNGQLVGIVNAKSIDESIDNMGYALPAATVRRVVNNMINRYEERGGETHGIYRAKIGIDFQLVGSSAYFNSETNLTEIVDTVQVYSVSEGLANGKLAEGDIIKNIKIVSSDGTVKEDVAITRFYSVSDIMLSAYEDDTVTITVSRSGSASDLSFSMVITSSSLTLEV